MPIADAPVNGAVSGPVIDPAVRRVLEALEDPRWDFRTVSGIAKSTDLTEGRVREVLESSPQWVRKAHVTDRQGQLLYALRSRRRTARELVATARAFMTGSAIG